MSNKDRDLATLIADGIALIPDDEVLSTIKASNSARQTMYGIRLGIMDVTIVTLKGHNTEKIYAVCNGPKLVLQSEVRS